MPAKIPKPTIPIKLDLHKSGILRFGEKLIKSNEEHLDAQKTQIQVPTPQKQSNNVQKYLKDYLLAVAKTGCSSSTIRNYRSDINQFLDFADSKDLDDLRNKPKLLAFAHYQRDRGLKENSVKRKLVSITQFKIWLKQQGLISSEIPLHSLENHETSDLKTRKIIDQGHKEEAKKTETPDIKNQKKSKQPQSRIFLLLNLLALFLFLGGLAFFAYQQFGQAIISLAYPSTPTAPNRVLSYQGRLTNTAQSPISDPTAMTYALYDNITGGNLLWSSNTCTIDPDQDGVFNANLGAGAGAGSDTENCGGTIGEDVFTVHNNVWLEVAVGLETLTPRQPIRTVAYALNSATLQGLPPAEVATNSTILMMNSNGELVLGMENPLIKTADDSSGLTIESKQITIQTTADSDGDIILAPDGDGILDIQGNANISGDTTLVGNVNLTSANTLIFGGTTALGEISSPTDSGAFLIGVYNEFDNSTSTNVQGVLNDLDAAIGSAGTQKWSSLTAPNTNLSLNHSTYTTGFNWATGTGANDLFSLTTDASSNGTGSLLNLQTGTSSTVSPLRVRAGSVEALFVDNSGEVGIGTTSPVSPLNVSTAFNSEQYGVGHFVNSYSGATNTIGISAQAMPADGMGFGGIFLGGSIGIIGGSIGSGSENYTGVLGTSTSTNTGINTGGGFQAFNGSSNIALRASAFAGSDNYALYADAGAKSYFEGSVGIGTTTPTNFKLQVAGHVGPEADSTYDLGSSSIRWANGYFDTLYGDGSNLTNVTASGVAFSGLSSGTNTTAAMVVGAGASLNYTSTGTINASSLLSGTWAAPGAIGSTTRSTGAFTTLSSTGNTTIGDASGDTLTANAAAWSFPNTTSFNLRNSTVNAFSFETSLMSFDTSNSRIGVGDTSPTNTLDVNGTIGLKDTQVLAVHGGAGNLFVGNGGSGAGANDQEKQVLV